MFQCYRSRLSSLVQGLFFLNLLFSGRPRVFNVLHGRVARQSTSLFDAVPQMVCVGLLLMFVSSAGAQITTERMPRTVLALYDSQNDGRAFNTPAHRFAEMPLNHLGLKVRFHDIQHELPGEEALTDVRGVLLWLSGTGVPDPDSLLRWLLAQTEVGRRVVMMGDHSFEQSLQGEPADPALVKAFWKSLGLKKTGLWVSSTYDLRFHAEAATFINYERSFFSSVPPFPVVNVDHTGANPHASLINAQQEKLADVVVTSSGGGYVAPGFSRIFTPQSERPYWFIDPFQFFKQAFALKPFPIPDTTTLAGRRIYYSHIDGDGWRNQTRIPAYKDRSFYSSEVILEEILLKYPDLPVTIAPVAGDLDENWHGTEHAVTLAREIFRLPHVEAASHSYSHPLYWDFFKNYSPQLEANFLEVYKADQGHKNMTNLLTGLFHSKPPDQKVALDSSLLGSISPKHISLVKEVMKTYSAPRAFYKGAYDLHHDITGSIEFIQTLLPLGKRVELLQWSGNTLPFAKAIRLSRQAGVRNLNGGDTRFDDEFDSVSWVMPIGRSVDGEQQIYASASNENTYTNLWTDRFYGFGFLTETLKRTGSPIRLKPINVYYHMYSGERLSSLNAVRKNLDYVRSQQVVPITASRYAAIADGFYATEIEPAGDARWRIHNRRALQTLRVDQATYQAVDFSQSEGVMGQMHLQGSLYIALDPSHPAPVIALKGLAVSSQHPGSSQPYLIHSRWPVEGFLVKGDGFEFKVQGFGPGRTVWYVPAPGKYRIRAQYDVEHTRDWHVTVGNDKQLTVALDEAPSTAVSIRITREVL